MDLFVTRTELWNFVKKNCHQAPTFIGRRLFPAETMFCPLLLSKVNAAAILLLCVHPRVHQNWRMQARNTRKQPEPFNYEAELLGSRQ